MTPLHLPVDGASARGSSRSASHIVAGAVCGLLAAGTSIAVGHLVAMLVAPAASPILAVGSTFIDLTPEWLKSFAIRTFGTNDKIVLLGGISIVLALVAVAIGLVAMRRPRLAIGAVAGLGTIGALAAVARPTSSAVDIVPALAGAAAGCVALAVLLRAARPTPDAAGPESAGEMSRRRFLFAGAGIGVLAVASGGIGVLLGGGRASDASSVGGLDLPMPLEPAAAVPGGADLGIEGAAPFITPNDQFYRVDTALVVPTIAPADWRLRIHGMVDREITLTLPELLALPAIERDITLTCVSNQVGGEYAGNARWIGIPLATVLGEAGVQAAADQIVSRSIDGMSIGTPTAIALDGRDAMLAVGMNGAPLPAVHGAPVRLIVPGLYGYVSATKWLVELELTTFDAYDPYWVQRGWAKEGPIKTMSRIDAPKPLARIPAGTINVAGVAWAQHRGVERVEVRVDGGTWADAKLAAIDTLDTWRQWVYPWEAVPGNHTLEVRATDATGAAQPETRAEPFPDGATGWHSVVVSVT